MEFIPKGPPILCPSGLGDGATSGPYNSPIVLRASRDASQGGEEFPPAGAFMFLRKYDAHDPIIGGITQALDDLETEY